MDFNSNNVHLDSFTKKNYIVMYFMFFVSLVISALLSNQAPVNYFVKHATSRDIIPIQMEGKGCYYNSDKTSLDKPVKRCWQQPFRFHYIWTQYFALELIPVKKEGFLDLGEDKLIKMQVTWEGQSYTGMDEDGEEIFSDYEMIADEAVDRTTTCTAGETHCSPMIVFQATAVKYTRYFFQVELLGDDDTFEYLEGFNAMFYYRNKEYTIFEFIFKANFCIASLIVLICYIIRLRVMNGKMSYEQKWVLFLLSTLCLFNDPLNGMKYLQPSESWNWITSIFAATFFASLALFWLVTFDGLVHDPPFKMGSFYLPKIMYTGFIWAIFVVAYGSVQYTISIDVLYDWYQNQGLYNFLKIYAVCTALSYAVWLVYLLYKGSAELKSMSPKRRALYYFHLLVLVICITNAVVIELRGITATTVIEYIFYYGLFNTYVFILVYLYTPSVSMSKRKDFKDLDDGDELEAMDSDGMESTAMMGSLISTTSTTV